MILERLSYKSRLNKRQVLMPETKFIDPTALKPLVQRNVKLSNMISFPVDVLLHMQKMNQLSKSRSDTNQLTSNGPAVRPVLPAKRQSNVIP